MSLEGVLGDVIVLGAAINVMERTGLIDRKGNRRSTPRKHRRKKSKR